VLDLLREAGLPDLPVVVGGTIPPADAQELLARGVRRVFTPRDYSLDRAIGEAIEIAAEAARARRGTAPRARRFDLKPEA